MYRSTGGAAEYYWGGWFYSTSGSDTCYASFDKTGHYSCTVTAYNSAGEIQSSWIGWDIVDEAPKNVWVSLPNGPESSYLPNTTVEITFGAEYADTYQIRMCREYDGVVDWEYYIHSFRKDPNGNNICYASFDKLGHYSCYIWATNVIGGTSSEWIGWDIVDSVPSGLSISTDKSLYTVNSSVNFTLTANYGYYKHIGIHKIVNSQNQLYHEQDVSGSKCSVKITEPGYYRANFDAFNACGTTRSEFVYFKVYSLGDADEDSVIGLKDVVQITRYLAGGWGVTIDMTASDVNKDGEVNLKDAVLLRRYLAGGWGVKLD